MKKELKFNNECRSKLFNGIKKVNDAVSVTLGPNGKLVLIEDNGKAKLTKDGVTVAKAIELEDPIENMGAKLAIEVASKTNEVAGDNTTSSTVLAYSIVKDGMKALAAGMNAVELKKGIEAATNDIVTELKKMSKSVSDVKDITNVATISANNNPEVGKVLAEAFEKIGKDGVITVEQGNDNKTTVKVVEGLQIEKGWKNQYFALDKEKMITEFDNAYILVTDKIISTMKDLMPIVEPVASSGKPLVIICDDMDGEALGTIVINTVRGAIKCCVVQAPSFGDNKKNILNDIAAFTGATFFCDELGYTLDQATITSLGTAKVKISENNTTFTNGGADKKVVEDYIETLKKQAEAAKEDYNKNKILSRIAKLTGGVAVVSVGGNTETEIKEKRYLIDDAISATKAALKDGILPGGGIALINAGKKVVLPADSVDYNAGYKMLIKALELPLIKICENSGVNGEVVINNIKDKPDGFGYNAKTEKYVDMISDGVVDTTLAMTEALKNASSIASMVLTTDCTITNIPEETSGGLVASPVGMLPA